MLLAGGHNYSCWLCLPAEGNGDGPAYSSMMPLMPQKICHEILDLCMHMHIFGLVQQEKQERAGRTLEW